MDLSFPTPTTNSPLIPVFGDNVQDLLGVGTLQVNPSAIITVNSAADALDDLNSGVTTLRDAINQANGDTGSDLIVFERSLFSNAQTISLNLGELDITKGLDIIAPRDSLTGEDLLTVSGNKATRVFEIEKEATVSLDGLIVADGKVTLDGGGGIKNSGTLTLDSSIVTNNFVTSTLDEVGNGGGIYNSGTMTVSNSTISSNSATGVIINYSAKGGNGGGIYNTSGATLTVNNCDIRANGAKGGNGTLYNGSIDGGGIYNNSGTVNLSNSTISSNAADDGGGIYNSSGIIEVSNSTISANETDPVTGGHGGGISNTGTLNVSNSTISGNFTGNNGKGGGIYNSSGNVNLSSSTISANVATDGGGIFNGGTLTVNNSTISSNVSSLGSKGDRENSHGGGIDNGGTLNVSNSTISGNHADYNSGGGINNSGTLNVSNSTISGNLAAFAGGGISNLGTLTLVFSTLTLNSAANGGGIYNNNDPNEFVSGNGMIHIGVASVRNTIIASNLAVANKALGPTSINPDVSGTTTSNGYNLIGNSTGSTGFDEGLGDIIGTSDNPIDPRLAPLDFNGGPTQTIALLPDSLAIDAGDPTVLDTDPTTDQRGLPRVSNGRSDIGAFEVQV